MTVDTSSSEPSPPRWKWFFAYNGSYSDVYDLHIRVMVRSAMANTSLDPHFLYAGPPDNSILPFLEGQGVKIIRHSPSILPDLERTKAKFPHYPLHIATGAFMRIDVPAICRDLGYDDEAVLYTDCDVMFVRDIPRERHESYLRPTIFSCAPQFVKTDRDDINSGVLVLNVEALLEELSGLKRFIATGDRLNDELVTGGFDQGALRTYFRSKWNDLPLEYNWKPYWGINEDTLILHFHGPKIPHIRSLMNGQTKGINQRRQDLFACDPGAYRHYLAKAEEYM